MLPSHKRLAAAQVREILKNGSTVRSGPLVLKYQPSSKGAAAIVISKKVAKTAVTRNRVRRSLYRALSKSLPRARMVVMVQKLAPDYSEDIAKLCSKLS